MRAAIGEKNDMIEDREGDRVRWDGMYVFFFCYSPNPTFEIQ